MGLEIAAGSSGAPIVTPWRAVATRISLIWPAVSLGLMALSIAAAPATCGAEKELPSWRIGLPSASTPQTAAVPGAASVIS